MIDESPRYAYFRLGLYIDGADGARPPIAPAALAEAIERLRPSVKELIFLRRLCRSRNDGALLAVVSAFGRVATLRALPVLLEHELDDDGAHNARARCNAERLTAVVVEHQQRAQRESPPSATGSRARTLLPEPPPSLPP
jgi:HEAT repeat protein